MNGDLYLPLFLITTLLVIGCPLGKTRIAVADSSPQSMSVIVTPSNSGKQLVRASLPFPRGFMSEGQALVVTDGHSSQEVGFRALTWHPLRGNEPRSVRRGLVSFPYTFVDQQASHFVLETREAIGRQPAPFPVEVEMQDEQITIAYPDGVRFEVRLQAPARTSAEPVVTEDIESNTVFGWRKTHLPDPQWPRTIEVRQDVLGSVVLVAHLQRNLPDRGTAPDFGWEILSNADSVALHSNGHVSSVTDEMTSHAFSGGQPCEFSVSDGRYAVYHPTAHFKRRGRVESTHSVSEGLVYRYWRCTADEQVPMQEAAWRRAEVVIAPASLGHLTASLESPHLVEVDQELWASLYDLGPPLELESNTELEQLLQYHHTAIRRSAAQGDDWGNVTGYSDSRSTGGIYGMNRLNHCPAIFRAGYRSGDQRLLETAVQWCENFFDQSIWWGPNGTGGTRYNNVSAMRDVPRDPAYMWRSDSAVHFCTKGYDSFFMAYEHTGDPRMMEALDAQVQYAAEHIHTDRGEARNIGDVADFVQLHRFTGERHYLDEAIRLFQELRTKLSPGDLFSQSGRPIVPDPPFIDDDQTGYKHPFAKPYIIGYALSGLPALLTHTPDEPKLRDVVEAVADFLSTSQDPLGGWRYPHPRSSGLNLSQAMEHAWQIVQADRALGTQEVHLDAIEGVLRQRVQGWLKTGRIFGGLTGWEITTGEIQSRQQLYELYEHPEDRDFTRDYAEGNPGFGGSPPEGLVYFPEVLAFYLQHRPASRLLDPPAADSPLGQVLARVGHVTAVADRHTQQPVTAKNPQPSVLPTLGVWERDGLTLVSASFPGVPDFTCDSWCYESQVDFLDAVPLGNGRLQLRHRDRARPHVLILTTVTPEPGAIEFKARMELDTANHPNATMPETPTSLNLCWQLQRAPTFASAPDSYPEFVRRCFIFTEQGRTFLGDTVRRKIPCRPADHQYNTPPWVQMYVGTWQNVPKTGPESWADYSPNRYTTTVMGAISRDGRHLAAIATDSATMMAQAWHDCMHNNPQWLPVDAPVEQRRWRAKIYVMDDEPEALLQRVGQDFPGAKHSYQRLGVQQNLPVFRDRLAERLTFPLSWLVSPATDFGSWRTRTRATVMEHLLTPPPASAFAPVVLDEQERGSYLAQKVALNITADSRALGYILIPKGEGPFPAVLLLHDHGARFDIGKEKVIRPWNVPQEQLESAKQWVQECYGGRWIGDELAKRGYVCFSTDALNWSDRGGAGYEGQQALAGNLLHLGMSFAGLIAHEDLRAAEFLATHPQVDSDRVAAMGLSMGSFRTWQVSALSEHIAAGVAICWMATVKGLMVSGNNQTGGQSAFTMTHPGLFNHLDYPDVASLACPKPMLFYNGEQDGLFPIPAVQDAYVKMRQVWESQNAGERLVTQLWDVPHEFNQEMQEAAFAWLTEQMENR